MFLSRKREYFLLIKIGLVNYLKYKIARSGDIVSLKLKYNLIFVRKGSPDLRVAISCLIDGEFDALSNFMEKDFNGTIVDAGGYIGTAALALSNMFPAAQVITIEPSQDNLKILRQNVHGNDRIRVIGGALVGRDVENVVLKDPGRGEWGYTTIDEPSDSKDVQSIQHVPAFTLSKLGVNTDEIGILKLDIEGGEHDLLRNDPVTLKRIRIIVVELHDYIVAGCSDEFKSFSADRVTLNADGEKHLSISKS